MEEKEVTTDEVKDTPETSTTVASETQDNASQKVETKKAKEDKKSKVVEVKAKDVNKKKKKDKKPSKVASALKSTGHELKKITWPKFKQVVKQTGVVLAVVLIAFVVLFGFDRLCALLYGLLLK